jgi:hypothetical protein
MSTATRVIRQTKIVKDSAAKAGKDSTDKFPAKTAAVKAEAEGQKMTQCKRLCP